MANYKFKDEGFNALIYKTQINRTIQLYDTHEL